MTSWKSEKDVKSLAQKVWRHAEGQRPMNIFVHYPVGKKYTPFYNGIWLCILQTNFQLCLNQYSTFWRKINLKGKNFPLLFVVGTLLEIIVNSFKNKKDKIYLSIPLGIHVMDSSTTGCLLSRLETICCLRQLLIYSFYKRNLKYEMFCVMW